jgi:hypothetical protein
MQVGGVAFGTHVIPVLGNPGPVKHIIGRDPFIPVNVEPKLSALLGRAGIPAYGQALVPSSWKFYQVLLQGPHPKHIIDLVVLHAPIRPFRMYHEFPIGTVKPRCDTEMGESNIVEISQHRFFGGCIHGHVVIRSLKRLYSFS